MLNVIHISPMKWIDTQKIFRSSTGVYESTVTLKNVLKEHGAKMLKSYQEKEGISQSELSRVLGVNRGYVSKILNNETRLTLAMAAKIGAKI